MISSYKKLSTRYLKTNKKRTILTIIGIILSVALISCIGLFISNIQNSMLEQAKSNYGGYHVSVVNAKKNDIEKFRINPKVDACGLSEEVRENEEKTFIKDKMVLISKGDSESFKFLKVNFLEGGFPTNEKEMAIQKRDLKAFGKDVKLGSKIYIKNDKGIDNSYIIKGIIANDENTQISGFIKAFTYVKTPTENTEILIKFKDNVDKKRSIKEFQDTYGVENVKPNDGLLRLTGDSSSRGFNNSIISTFSIVISIVVIATIFVIYNAFNISIAERMKQLGLLRAIGTTKKQMRKIVIKEATIMSVIGIPIGLLCGIIAIYIVFFVFTRMPRSTEFSNIKIIIDFKVLSISFIIGLISVYASAFLPILAAGKISPLVAINNGNLITKEKSKKGKKWLSKVFKIYKVMAIKNVKRNKKRFYLSTISMAISVTLFVTFSSLINISEKFIKQDNESKNYHFELKSTDSKVPLSSNIVNDVKNINGVSKVTNNYNSVFFYGLVDDNKISERFKNSNYNIQSVKLNGKNTNQMNVVLEFYDKDKMETTKKYIKQGNIDELKDNEIIIVRNNAFYDKDKKLNKSPIEEFNIGEELIVNLPKAYSEKLEDRKVEFTDKDVKKFKVKAFTDTLPFGSDMYMDSIRILARLEDKDKILGEKEAKEQVNLGGISINLKDTAFEKEVDEKLSDITYTNSKVMYVNEIQETKMGETYDLQIKILLMGFITVITLITSVNIINTVSTNIIIRRKELASLKAIGMTSQELKKMITLEGMLFGVYGGIIGSILGSIFSYLLYNQMSQVIGFNYSIQIKYIVIAIIGVVLIGYISALIPLGVLKNDNIIETIREN